MKIYSKVVIDMNTLLVIEEESFEYSGEIAECKSGGAGGGGSPSGMSDFPQYMKDVHGDWLNKKGTRSVLKSVVELMNDTMSGPSPYTGFSTVNIDDVFLGSNTAITSYVSPFSRLRDLSCLDVESKYSSFISDDNALVTTAINAESAMIDDEIFTKQLPRFQAAMDDINAVQSSPFIIGEAIIWDGKNKAISRASSAMRVERLNAQAEIALKRVGSYLEWSRIVNTLGAELSRMYITSRHDTDGLKVEIAAKDRMFDLNTYQYGVNVMSSISGSAVSPPDPGTSRSSSGGALSAALAGASIGMSIPGGGAMGAGIGAGVGLAAYYLM